MYERHVKLRGKTKNELSQSSYVERILETSQMSNCNPTSTPMESNLTLSPANVVMNLPEYRSIVGAVLYLARLTRPDVLPSVSILSRYLHCPGSDHITAAKRILRYLRSSKSFGSIFTGKSLKSQLHLSAYVDSNWANDLHDRKSTSGFAIYLNDNLLSFKSTKQKIVALSSTEAEYIAISTVTTKILWLLQLFDHLQITIQKPIPIHVDNNGAIKLASNNHSIGERSKHIDLRYHHIKDLISNGTVELQYIPTSENIADMFTKALPKPAFLKYRSSLQVVQLEGAC